MREDAVEQYLAYKLIDSNQNWKSKWFYITNHHPELPKPSGKQPKHQPWWNTEPTVAASPTNSTPRCSSLAGKQLSPSHICVLKVLSPEPPWT
jgi:hypothetical protein